MGREEIGEKHRESTFIASSRVQYEKQNLSEDMLKLNIFLIGWFYNGLVLCRRQEKFSRHTCFKTKRVSKCIYFISCFSCFSKSFTHYASVIFYVFRLQLKISAVDIDYMGTQNNIVYCGEIHIVYYGQDGRVRS